MTKNDSVFSFSLLGSETRAERRDALTAPGRAGAMSFASLARLASESATDAQALASFDRALENGANPNAKSAGAQTLVAYACGRGAWAAAVLLLAHGAWPEEAQSAPSGHNHPLLAALGPLRSAESAWFSGTERPAWPPEAGFQEFLRQWVRAARDRGAPAAPPDWLSRALAAPSLFAVQAALFAGALSPEGLRGLDGSPLSELDAARGIRLSGATAQAQAEQVARAAEALMRAGARLPLNETGEPDWAALPRLGHPLIRPRLLALHERGVLGSLLDEEAAKPAELPRGSPRL
jgi:hypothetical protein